MVIRIILLTRPLALSGECTLSIRSAVHGIPDAGTTYR